MAGYPERPPGGLDHYVSATLRRWDTVDHPVALAEGSRLAGLLGTTSVALNSLHHQAVKRLGAGLRAVGYAPDGVVEAIEGESEAFVMGVQGHPETLWQATEPLWSRLFAALVAAATPASVVV